MNINELIQSEDITAQFSPEDIEAAKVCSILAYLLPFLFFLPFISVKGSQAARFNSNQSFLIFLLGIACGIINIIPILGNIISFVLGVIEFILIVLGIINTANGKIVRLPVLKAVNLEVFK